MDYIDFLLNSEKWFLFFSLDRANEKIEDLKKQGFSCILIKERDSCYTVFQMNK
jgi:hypothetical protein